MKINFLLLSAATFFSFNSFAETSKNTISFQGEISSQTCEVTVNGNDKSPVIVLPTVSENELNNSANKTAGLTKFTIGVNNCTGGNGVKMSTVLVAGKVSDIGNLANTGTAKNVEIQILKNDSSALRNGRYVGDNDFKWSDDQKSASSEFAAQYLAPNGGAQAGTVLSTLQYAVSYK